MVVRHMGDRSTLVAFGMHVKDKTHGLDLNTEVVERVFGFFMLYIADGYQLTCPALTP
jgi:hypothetical protein